jgi:serine protease Do
MGKINVTISTQTGRAALGGTVTSVDATLAAQNELSVDHGALIVSVTPNGAAAQAGLKPGNVIVQIGDKAVDDVPSLGDALVDRNAGEAVSVQVYRGNLHRTVNVTLGELQAE